MLVRLRGDFADYEIFDALRGRRSGLEVDGHRLHFRDAGEVAACLGRGLTRETTARLRAFVVDLGEWPAQDGEARELLEQLARLVLGGRVAVVRVVHELRASDVVESPIMYERAPFEPFEFVDEDLFLWTEAEHDDVTLDVESEYDDVEVEASARVDELELAVESVLDELELETWSGTEEVELESVG